MRQQFEATRAGHAQLPYGPWTSSPWEAALHRKAIRQASSVDLVGVEFQAVMLGYLEQGPLANSCNFSWAVLDGSNFSGAANVAAASNFNRTVLFTNVSSFMCPSDPTSARCRTIIATRRAMERPPRPVITGPMAVAGASPTMGESAAESTGVFTIGKSYGLQSITDGSSNTGRLRRGARGRCKRE